MISVWQREYYLEIFELSIPFWLTSSYQAATTVSNSESESIAVNSLRLVFLQHRVHLMISNMPRYMCVFSGMLELQGIGVLQRDYQ
jgi:hypothetical protein